ncbi:MAG: hypothetical protein QM778_18895 [Myxococcales bacterium]
MRNHRSPLCALSLLTFVVALPACGDDDSNKSSGDAGPAPDAASEQDAQTPAITYPNGPTFQCSGDLCPKGECRPKKYASGDDVACEDVYPKTIDKTFEYCPAAAVGMYCISTSTGDSQAYVVTCDHGVKAIEHCADNCFGTVEDGKDKWSCP